jgi:hypothetical protein
MSASETHFLSKMSVGQFSSRTSCGLPHSLLNAAVDWQMRESRVAKHKTYLVIPIYYCILLQNVASPSSVHCLLQGLESTGSQVRPLKFFMPLF